MAELVSVVIPTYNAGHAVLDAIESVKTQSWPNVEIIVIDDGSSDNTREMLDSFIESVRYVYQGNQGRSAARNRGINLAVGDYVAFLDADDTWYPRRLEQQLALLKDHPRAGWGYGKHHLIDMFGKPVQSDFWPESFGTGVPGTGDIFERLLHGGLGISTSTIIVKRELLDRVGGFDETLVTGEDTDMWLRLAYSSPVLFVPDVLATRRVDLQRTFLDIFSSYNSAYYSLQVLRKNLRRFGLDVSASHVATEALYNGLVNSALIELSVNNPEQAAAYWQEATSLPEKADSVRTVGARIAFFAISAARYHANGPIHAEEILNSLLPEFPIEDRYRSLLRRVACAEFYAAVAYMYDSKRQKRLATEYARRALFSGTSQWRNLGLWKQSLLHRWQPR